MDHRSAIHQPRCNGNDLWTNYVELRKQAILDGLDASKFTQDSGGSMAPECVDERSSRSSNVGLRT